MDKLEEKSNKKPIIGIVAKFNDFDDPNFLWRRQVFDGITRSLLIKHGALVIGILPQNKAVDFNDNDEGKHKIKMDQTETRDFIETLKLCDGVVLQGGGNSDYYEEFTAKYCFENDIPLLGICAGYNNIVRGLGGKTKRSNEKFHNQFGKDLVHKITIQKNSFLNKITGSTELVVNSIHSFEADKLKSVAASSFAEDGCIESVENDTKRFFLGVKFHPELLAKSSPQCDNIFKIFVEKCKEANCDKR